MQVMYEEGYPTFDVGFNRWDFNRTAFSRDPIPSSTFDLPPGIDCTGMCAMSTVPYKERLARVFAPKQ